MSRLVFVLGLIVSVFLASLSFAGIPKLINYQGMLTQSDGKTPVTNGNYTILFSIYNISSGGSSLWSHTYNVAVTNGLFNVILGDSGAPINLPFDTTYWLGIKVGADPELSPRIRLTSVGYAYRAQKADTASVAISAPSGGGWTDDGANVRLTTNTDKVGIGTTDPKVKLDVSDIVRVGGDSWPGSGTGKGMELAYDTALHKGYIQVFNRAPGAPNGGWGNLYLGNGNVGIGASSPAQKLDVVGTAQVTGFKMPTGASNGYVLTSDASGVGTWQASASGTDKYWSFRVTDTNDTTIMTRGAWGMARYGNVLYGNKDSTHVNFGVACTTGFNGLNEQYCTVSGGQDNTASRNNSTVGGGSINRATGLQSTVGGGIRNVASGHNSTVGGGWFNTALGDYATVGGGESDSASQWHATVGGGYENVARGINSTVAGGSGNVANGMNASIIGGLNNSAVGLEATVAGGVANAANDTGSAIVGGENNRALGSYSIVGGGQNNTVWGKYSAILGGYSDTITSSAHYSYLFGIKSKLTQDSTFMVDMPHIRFGKESGGYEFPISDGSSWQVLTTDGAGKLGWQNVSTTGGGWTDDGVVVRLTNTSDKVGIGTTSPSEKLQVDGSVQLNKNGGVLTLRTPTHDDGGRYGIYFANNNIAPFMGDDADNQYFNFYSGFSGTRTYDAHLSVFGRATGWGNYIDITHDGTNGKISTDAGHIILNPASNVAIGNITPTQKLDVAGTARLRGIGSSGSGTAVIADANGVLYKLSSSERFKENIRELKTDPQAVLKLQPKRFKWKSTGQEDVGLIAEEVEQQIPDLVIYDNEGRPDAVKYDAVTLYLLELVKEQQKKIETLEAKLDKLEPVH
jgi:hypothetical protein